MEVKVGDKILECALCHTPFVHTEGNQELFQKRGLREPRMCPTHREGRNPFLDGDASKIGSDAGLKTLSEFKG